MHGDVSLTISPIGYIYIYMGLIAVSSTILPILGEILLQSSLVLDIIYRIFAHEKCAGGKSDDVGSIYEFSHESKPTGGVVNFNYIQSLGLLLLPLPLYPSLSNNSFKSRPTATLP